MTYYPIRRYTTQASPLTRPHLNHPKPQLLPRRRQRTEKQHHTLRGLIKILSGSMTVNKVSTRPTAHPGGGRGAPGDPCTRAAAGARVTCGVSARSRRARDRGRAEAAEQAGPDSRALGRRRGAPSRLAAALASLRASPARSPKRTGQRGDYYPVIAPRTVATMRARNPGAAGREPESREPGSAAPSAREPSTLLERTSPGQATLGVEVIPRGRGREGTGPGAPRGSPPEERRGSHARPPGAARRPGSAARPPFRPAAARRLRPRPAPGLGRRGPSHCDTAAPGRACAADSPRPRRRRHSPAFPGCLNGSGDVSTWSLGPAPVKSPSRQGLAASLSRRGCPAWSCVRHGSRLLLLPARPPALLPPPPPPPPAPRNLRPLAFPPPLPALPASPATAPVGKKLVGEGRNAPPSASGAGEPGNRRRHLPTSPRRGRGPETSRPPAAPSPGPPAPPRTRSRGCSLPESPRPLAPNPGALPDRAQRILLQPPGLPRLELRATRLPPPPPPCPPAGPPPAAAAAAACTTQPPPSSLSSAAPRPPRLTGYGSRGEEAGGGGPERTAIGVRGGGTGKPSPPSPHQPAAREGPGNLPPAGGPVPRPPSATEDPLAGLFST
ncbi:PREDICTED: collagen alpha-1(I) chain-like [Lipotes vexillifer]|uniref:Collagen alpha-1(I) chain-like n=1 Tax=Lipotes vexillifer TaxID=118797 RepID=A0A340YET4_LIPVE|nr:PREDICTED: collagen alpha-1(I) chain-like [Lipotes vexillifer]